MHCYVARLLEAVCSGELHLNTPLNDLPQKYRDLNFNLFAKFSKFGKRRKETAQHMLVHSSSGRTRKNKFSLNCTLRDCLEARLTRQSAAIHPLCLLSRQRQQFGHLSVESTVLAPRTLKQWSCCI